MDHALLEAIAALRHCFDDALLERQAAVDAHPVERVVDTTGAGDLYAAGFLLGLARGVPLERCAQLGGLAAAEVIGHLGARPLVPLEALAAEAGLLEPTAGGRGAAGRGP